MRPAVADALEETSDQNLVHFFREDLEKWARGDTEVFSYPLRKSLAKKGLLTYGFDGRRKRLRLTPLCKRLLQEAET